MAMALNLHDFIRHLLTWLLSLSLTADMIEIQQPQPLIDRGGISLHYENQPPAQE